MEIKDKKGSDNVIADHLSRLEMTTDKGKEIEIKNLLTLILYINQTVQTKL